MSFEALANLLFSSCHKVDNEEHLKGIGAIPAKQVVEIFTAWINAKKPKPDGWDWNKVGVSPLQFLIEHFDPLYGPLIVNYLAVGYDSRETENFIPYFELEQLTARDQTKILQTVLHEVGFDTTGNKLHKVFHEVVARCRPLQPHLFAWFMKQQGFDINRPNAQGKTALHVALAAKHYQTVRVLLSFNASVDIPNSKGETPKQIIATQVKPQLKLLESFQVASDEKEQLPTSVSEAEFKAAVEKFTQHSDIPTIFSDKQPTFPLLPQIFLTDPIIQAYLTRTEFSMTSAGIPTYSEEEKSIYLGMHSIGQFGIYLFPYRTDGEEDRDRDPFESKDDELPKEHKQEKPCYKLFSQQGTHPWVTLARINQTRNKLAPNQPIYLLFSRDPYVLGEILEKIAMRPDLRCNDAGFTFVISAMPKDNHIVTMISVISKVKKEILYHVLLDSGKPSDEYLECLSIRINHFKTVNPFTEERRLAPLVGASLGVQISQEDGNCGIYTMVFCEALVVALQDNKPLQELLQRVRLEECEQTQADQVSKTLRYQVSPSSVQELVPALHRAIHSQTPQFFERGSDGVYVPKSYEDLKDFFAHYRWETGRLYFSKTVNETRLALEKLQQQFSYFVKISEGERRPSLLLGNLSAFFQEEKEDETGKQKKAKSTAAERTCCVVVNCSVM